jgi:hypothetical protein
MSRIGRRALLASLIALGAPACAPLTFSNDGEIDFEKYPSAFVSVLAPVDPEDNSLFTDYSAYLAGELRRDSGFELVTTDASRPASLVLEVDVAVDVETTTDSDGRTVTRYHGIADFRALTPAGGLVLGGSEEDTSDTFGEAIEDVLDEVALRFFAPYRI